jgi:hypothetical protein
LAHVDYSDAGYGRFNPGGAKIDDHSVVPLAPDVPQGGKHAQHSPGQALWWEPHRRSAVSRCAVQLCSELLRAP